MCTCSRRHLHHLESYQIPLGNMCPKNHLQQKKEMQSDALWSLNYWSNNWGQISCASISTETFHKWSNDSECFPYDTYAFYAYFLWIPYWFHKSNACRKYMESLDCICNCFSVDDGYISVNNTGGVSLLIFSPKKCYASVFIPLQTVPFTL